MGSFLASLGCLRIEREWSGCLYLRSPCTLCVEVMMCPRGVWGSVTHGASRRGRVKDLETQYFAVDKVIMD